MKAIFYLFPALLLAVLTSKAENNKTDSLQLYDLEEVVITATKTERNKRDIPSRISVINSKTIELSSGMQLDDIIRFIPGVNVNRSSGIYSQRPTVTLRGLSGDEQARTLVLLNGIPINTSDEGGVNWNRINQYDIEKIEVFKGPGSSLYGNNAMGGVINLITKTPQKPQEVYSGVSIGTHNTIRQDLNVRLRTQEGYYGILSQHYVKSDGYHHVPEANRTIYDTERYMEAIGVSARLGYDKSKWFNWEMQYDIFRDKRSEGMQIFAPDGDHRNFNTNLLRGNIKGGNEKTSYTLSAYYQLENYYNLNERMRDENYSRFDVNSDREDLGALLNINRQISASNSITGGFEYKEGSISGGDYYQTAPYDTIYNAGNISTLAGYIQDEQALFDNKIRLIAGLRFDRVTFSEGEFYSTDPWETTPELNDNTWNSVSPRAGMRFNFIESLSSYISYSRGFRASILDDLTRTGWMWVGPKLANPDLEPESLDSYEVGLDIFPTNHMKITASAYIMSGHDFLYYVATGDSIYGRPAYRRENVTNVSINGFETEIEYEVFKNLFIIGGYSYCQSKITEFNERPELENKHLKYVPKHSASLSVFWQNKYVNISTRALYKSKQFADDINDIILDDYLTMDIMLSKTLKKKYIISIDIQNIFDNKHMENINFISPGRLVTARLALKI